MSTFPSRIFNHIEQGNITPEWIEGISREFYSFPSREKFGFLREIIDCKHFDERAECQGLVDVILALCKHMRWIEAVNMDHLQTCWQQSRDTPGYADTIIACVRELHIAPELPRLPSKR